MRRVGRAGEMRYRQESVRIPAATRFQPVSPAEMPAFSALATFSDGSPGVSPGEYPVCLPGLSGEDRFDRCRRESLDARLRENALQGMPGISPLACGKRNRAD